jgi:hypothetical protein
MGPEPFIVRRATIADAADVSTIWEQIVADRKFSADARAWLPSEQESYLRGLSPRWGV